MTNLFEGRTFRLTRSQDPIQSLAPLCVKSSGFDQNDKRVGCSSPNGYWTECGLDKGTPGVSAGLRCPRLGQVRSTSAWMTRSEA